MKQFTAWEYLMIDLATQWGEGLDKVTFEERIEWAQSNLKDLHEMCANRKPWKERPLFLAALQAVDKVRKGEPTGHLVGLDASCSGIQIMSTITGCERGAMATGLVNPDVVADAYTDTTQMMREILKFNGMDSAVEDIKRKEVKNAVMTAFYGSVMEPIKLFGEETPELEAFYLALAELAPGANWMLEVLRNAWKPHALSHEWQLPDGYEAKIKVMEDMECRIRVPELGDASFTLYYKENIGKDRGVALIANIVHSLDAYLLRQVIRRCSYDATEVLKANDVMVAEMLSRSCGMKQRVRIVEGETPFDYYKALLDESGVVDPVIYPHIDNNVVSELSTNQLKKLIALADRMLSSRPFDVITVHDEFKCLPGNMNKLREHYKNVLADFADSKVLKFILGQLNSDRFFRGNPHLSDVIKRSNYALS